MEGPLGGWGLQGVSEEAGSGGVCKGGARKVGGPWGWASLRWLQWARAKGFPLWARVRRAALPHLGGAGGLSFRNCHCVGASLGLASWVPSVDKGVAASARGWTWAW